MLSKVASRTRLLFRIESEWIQPSRVGGNAPFSPSYIDKIERYLGKETIIVLVGQRRVGKSCMMKMIRDRKIKLSYLCNRKSCLNYYEK